VSGPRSVVVEGTGLHTGETSRVVLLARPGPVRLRVADVESPIAELDVVSTARATTVECGRGGPRVGTVEHCFAALAGLGVRQGVTIEVHGREMPLLDGGAVAWCRALGELDLAPTPPILRVAREAVLEVGPSVYELAPGDRVHVEVHVDFADARIAPDASWDGDPADFATRVAPARTFALVRELDELLSRGLARRADPASVVVITPEAVLCAGRPFEADEPARHKLLDLLGDMTLVGGPPRGRIRAVRPGHAPNARALRRALEQGLLTADTAASPPTP
jgi:UDP-3-O-[3-hydroxymyristoyl] N-acetylglucosamine deacetylase